MSQDVRCGGCGARVPGDDGPVHAYVPSAPGCWRTFGEVQADELARFGYPASHGLVVDSYMAQHPGNGSDRRDRQSVFVHLVALCAALENAQPAERVRRLRGACARGRRDFPRLQRDGGPGRLTILHMIGAGDLEDYDRRAREWAGAVWAAWSGHHAEIRAALTQLSGP